MVTRRKEIVMDRKVDKLIHALYKIKNDSVDNAWKDNTHERRVCYEGGKAEGINIAIEEIKKHLG